MGITKFRTFINDYDKVKFKGKLDKISSLFIDCNGIFHKGKGEIYKLSRHDKGPKIGTYIYSDKDREKISKQDPIKLENQHIKFIIDEFEIILKKFKPSSTLILAPDGMAPAAKMQQQKERRYGSNPEEDKLFMGAKISPGTEFMMKLDIAIREWLSKENPLFPKKVIYSSHLIPGEGEHKIFDFIRNHDIETHHGNHVIYGADGDLFIISLFSPLRNIYLFNENSGEYYTINKLKTLITKDMRYNEYDTKPVNPQLLRDFCFLTFLIGNDFIHRMPNLYNTSTSLKILIDCYKKNKRNLTNFKNQIQWKNFLFFLKILRDYKIEDMSLYEFNTFSTFTSLHTKGWVPYPEMRESMDIYDLKNNKLDNDTIYDPSKNSYKFNIKNFAKLWYDKQFKPQNLELQKLYKNKNFYNTKDVEKMCENYFKILQWCLQYYNNGDKNVNKLLFYPFYFTPLIESMISYLEYKINVDDLSFEKNILDNSGYSLTPIHQLMLILSPHNKMIIPSPFRELYTDKLSSISPIEFTTLGKEGTDADHVKIKLIPPINPFLVMKVIDMSNEKIPEEYNIVRPLIIKKNIEEKIKNKKDYSISQEEVL